MWLSAIDVSGKKNYHEKWHHYHQRYKLKRLPKWM
jgi:hypothetical protein